MNKMMNNGQVMAVLAASGLNENNLTEMQKTVQKTNIKLKVIGLDQGLLSSWNGSGWGLSFTADALLNQALAADYDALFIPGGQRSIDKLKMTAHTKRFINGFLDNGKPVVMADEAVELLMFAEKMADRTVAAKEEMKAKIETAGGTCTQNMVEQQDNLMTVNTAVDAKAPFAPMAIEFVAGFGLQKAA